MPHEKRLVHRSRLWYCILNFHQCLSHVEPDMPVDKNPSEVFRVCLDYYITNNRARVSGSLYNNIRDYLGTFLTATAELHAKFYGWIADPDHPGYLIRIDPPATIRAPYHLVPSFPSAQIFDSIWKVACRVRTMDNSIMCLSGSAAVIRSSLIVSDIDFCEYIIGTPADIASSLVRHKDMDPSVVFLRLKFAEKSWDRANFILENLEMLRLINPSIDRFSHGMVEYIAHPDQIRPIEASNKLIFCDQNWMSSSIDRSFRAQEAILSPSAFVPFHLNDPFEMGRYMNWLIEKIEDEHNQRNYVKALKRSLSLARLCFLSSISERITTFIDKSVDFYQSELISVDHIFRIVEDLNSKSFTDWLLELNRAKSAIQTKIDGLKSNEDQSVLQDFCYSIAKELELAVCLRNMSLQ